MKKIIIIMTLLLVVTGCGCNNKKEEKKEIQKQEEIIKNINTAVAKDQNVAGLTMTNTFLIRENNLSKLTVLVKNETDNDIDLKLINVVFKDSEGKEILSSKAYIGNQVKKGEETYLQVSTNTDLSKAKEIQYKLIK